MSESIWFNRKIEKVMEKYTYMHGMKWLTGSTYTPKGEVRKRKQISEVTFLVMSIPPFTVGSYNRETLKKEEIQSNGHQSTWIFTINIGYSSVLVLHGSIPLYNNRPKGQLIKKKVAQTFRTTLNGIIYLYLWKFYIQYLFWGFKSILPPEPYFYLAIYKLHHLFCPNPLRLN